MNQFVIRPMLLEDIEAVAKIEKACFSRPWTEKTLTESFQNPIYAFFVAEDNQREIIGYIGYYGIFDEGDICNVAVLEKARGQKIAQQLLAALMRDAKGKEIKALVLEVRASNTPAIHIYEKAGFQPIGRRKDYYEEPREDALLYGISIEE